jgi:hypothetical protein
MARAEDGAMPALNAQSTPESDHRALDGRGRLGTASRGAHAHGKFYNIPLDPAARRPARCRDGSPRSSSSAPAQRQQVARIPGYLDFDSGSYLNVRAHGGKAVEARFFEAVGGAAGRDDQFHHVQFGRYNDWKMTAWFDGSPQTLTTNYRSLWGGMGTANLNLLNLKPGGAANANATQANIQNALAATEPSELEIVRRRAGARIDKTLTDQWKLFASFVDDKREGSRPFGAVFGGGGGGGNIEIPQSIDYETQDIVAGVQYAGERNSFNLRASASFFRNGIDTMTVQNPLFVTLNGTSGLSPNTFTQARFDLPPDNEAFNVKGEYAHAFPDFYRANLTATVAG